MCPKLTASILCLTLACVSTFDARAADDGQPTHRLPDLVDIQSVDGVKYIFDPGKVSAVYADYLVTVTKGNRRGTFHARRGPLTTHVLGIAPQPVPIGGTAEDFLDKTLHSLSKFVPLTLATGQEHKLYVKATTVTLIIPPPAGYRPNTNVTPPFVAKSFVYPGPPGGLAGVPRAWMVSETPDEVRKSVNAVRTKQQSLEQ